MSVCLPCVCVYMYNRMYRLLISDLCKNRIAPYLPERNYCVSGRVSVTVGGENCLMRIFLIYIRIIWMVKSSGMKWARRVARMREKRNIYSVFMGKHEGKRRLGGPRRSWPDDTKVGLK
jgi:hypothetical protein